MEDLAHISLFVKVARFASFTATAKSTGLSLATVSRRISMLEDELGAQLFFRTNRQVALTEAGRSLLVHAEAVMDELTRAREEISCRESEVRGLLRVQAQVTVGNRILVPAIRAFTALYPEIKIELLLVDEAAKLVEEGVDVAIKAGSLPDCALRVRKLCDMPDFKLCASPEYLARRGAPLRPEDLLSHERIGYRWGEGATPWTVIGPEGELTVSAGSTFMTNNMEAVRNATLNGIGIGLIPVWWIGDDLANKLLVNLLPDHDVCYPSHDGGVFAIWSDARFLPRRTRTFIDYLASGFRQVNRAQGEVEWTEGEKLRLAASQ